MVSRRFRSPAMVSDPNIGVIARPGRPKRYTRGTRRVGVIRDRRGRMATVRVPRLPPPEIKTFVRNTLLENSVDAFVGVPGFLSASAVATGDLDYERSGNKISTIGIRVSGTIHNPVGQHMFCRMLVLKKAQGNDDLQSTLLPLFDVGPTATIGDAAASTQVIYTPINENRFTVLQDKVWSFGPTSGAGIAQAIAFSEYSPVKTTIEFESNLGGSGIKNVIQVIFIAAQANNDLAATAALEVSACSELYFVDP